MFPDFPSNNLSNGTLSNRKHSFDLFSRSGFCQFADLTNIIFCQLGLVDLDPSWVSFRMRINTALFSPCSSTPRLTLLTIFLLRTHGKMLRVAAGWIIAGMKDEFCRPFSSSQKVHNSARPEGPRTYSAPITTNTCLSISPSAHATSPYPAIPAWALPRIFVDIRPEGLDLLVSKGGSVYSHFEHCLDSLISKILFRPVASVSALARVAVYFNTERAVQS